MRRITLLSAIIGSVLVLMVGCTSSSSQGHKAYAPHIKPADFTTKLDNEYFPLKPGTTFVYEGGTERGEMTVTYDTKKVMGVECVVVDDRGYEAGKLIEKTYDWFPGQARHRLVFRGGHQGVRERRGGEYEGILGGRGGRGQTRHHNALRS